MRNLFLLAATAAMAAAMPALAKPGQGKGGGHYTGHGRYGVNHCPPGLAAKGNGCLPPGQARKLFSVGQ
ncbi:MAG: hypothetical protein ABIW83_07460, partial [Allosphingosinicella sp.]